MNYYNEFDPNAAAWIRELIEDKLIPAGDVDERSIVDVRADDLLGYTQCHFFAGVAGWGEALRLARWESAHPLWTGSCPCQPFSCAGKGAGVKDERHLWPEFHRLIKACRPPLVFGEQVASAEVVGTELEAAFVAAVQGGDYAKANKLAKRLVASSSFHYPKRWVDGVQSDLEGVGYAFGFKILGTHSVGAPHIRQRLYWGARRITNYELRIGETAGWPTAVANPANGTPEDFLRRKQESVERGHAMGVCLSDINMVSQMSGWQPPKAGDGVFDLPRTSGRPMEKSAHLQTQVVAVAGWPTAAASNTKGSYQDADLIKERREAGRQQNLQDIVQIAGWPTPDCSDRRSAASKQQGCSNVAMLAGWTTPVANDSEQSRYSTSGRTQILKLPGQADLSGWPTPRSSEVDHAGRVAIPKPGSQVGLAETCAMSGWQTPQATDASGEGRDGRLKRDCNRDPETSGSYRWDLKDQVLQVFLPGTSTPSSSAGTKTSKAGTSAAGFRLNLWFSGWIMGFQKSWSAAGLRAWAKLKAASPSRRKPQGRTCCSRGMGTP